MTIYYGGAEDDSSKKRSFRLTEPMIKYHKYKGQKQKQNDPYGHFVGDSPYAAARKACNKIIHSLMADGKSPFGIQKFKFTVVEITRGSKGKHYSYYGENKLKKAIKKDFGGGKFETVSVDAKITSIKKSNSVKKSGTNNKKKSNNNKMNNNMTNKMTNKMNNKMNNNKPLNK